jgi:predicted secreted Zn-dependent protease
MRQSRGVATVHRGLGLLLSVFFALAVWVVPASAVKKFPTKYTYYLVAGKSAGEVFKSLSRRGPVFRGVRAYASTVVKPRQSGQLVSDGKSCRVQNYSYNSNFVINLPQLKNPAVLSGSARSNWSKFQAFAKRHEEEHRSIWLSCWSGLSKQISAMRDKTCSGLKTKVDKAILSADKACEKRHNALDQRDQRALRRHPFIQQSLGEIASN